MGRGYKVGEKVTVGYPLSELDNSYFVKIGKFNEYALASMLYLLKRISNAFGVHFAIVPPPEVVEYGEDSRPALDVFNKLKAKGIVHSLFSSDVHAYPDEPRFYLTQIVLPDTQGFGYSGSGKSLFKKSDTLWPALGEALERWALYNTSYEERTVTVEVYKSNSSMVDITAVAGFSEKLRQSHRSLCVENDSSFKWTDATSLLTGKSVRAPLQWFSFNHAIHGRSFLQEPLLSPIISTGAATSPTLESAITTGMLEVIERDAFMIYWLRKITPDLIEYRGTDLKKLKHIENMSSRYGLEFYFSYLKTDVPAHTVLCTIIDRTGVGPAVVVNTSSGFDIVECMVHALEGALPLRGYLRSRMSLLSSGENNEESYETYESRGMFWSKIERIEDMKFVTKGNLVQIESLPDYKAASLNTFKNFFLQKNFEVFYKEIIPSPLQLELDLYTVMVRIPKMQPIHVNERFRCDAGERLYSVPESLQLETSGAVLNTTPHPFL